MKFEKELITRMFNITYARKFHYRTIWNAKCIFCSKRITMNAYRDIRRHIVSCKKFRNLNSDNDHTAKTKKNLLFKEFNIIQSIREFNKQAPENCHYVNLNNHFILIRSLTSVVSTIIIIINS